MEIRLFSKLFVNICSRVSLTIERLSLLFKKSNAIDCLNLEVFQYIFTRSEVE